MASVKAQITPEILRWARETCGITVSVACEKLKVSEGRLTSWEEGIDQPTYNQLMKIVKLYKRPLAVFYLPQVPDGPTLEYRQDYRRLPGMSGSNPSSTLIFELRRCEYRRKIALDLHEEMEINPPVVPQMIQPFTDIDECAERARLLSDISVEWQSANWKTSRAAFNGWRDVFERIGILVFHASGIELSEMRAISVKARPFPFIVLNSKDSVNGRIFSLAHEFIHILLIGERSTDTSTVPEEQHLEIFCNAVAGAFLMPRNAVEQVLERLGGNIDNHNIEVGARFFRVSREAYARRLLTLFRISNDFYLAQRELYQREVAEESSDEKSGGPQFFRRVVYAAGYRFSELVLEGLDVGAINTKDASDYLGASAKHLPAIRGLVRKHQEGTEVVA